MEVSITKMSRNGQVVIPAEIRRDAGLKSKTKFLVFNEDGNIMLKIINEDMLRGEIDLINRIEKSEREVKEGKAVKADTKMPVKEIDDLLMGD